MLVKQHVKSCLPLLLLAIVSHVRLSRWRYPVLYCQGERSPSEITLWLVSAPCCSLSLLRRADSAPAEQDVAANTDTIAVIEADYTTGGELDGFATESWVEDQGYGGGVDGLSDYLSVEQTTKTVVFSGANIVIRSGSGYTDDGGSLEGLGNLFIGYNEDSDSDEVQTGSHNLIIGDEHSFTSYGGIVAGYDGAISGAYSTISGGLSNTASGDYSSISGGSHNTASGERSAIGGGGENIASAYNSAIIGGEGNETSSSYATISGGAYNVASNYYASVSGGVFNTASGNFSSVSGGGYNTASGSSSSISGSNYQTASSSYSYAP
jgi:hypothetical protein